MLSARCADARCELRTGAAHSALSPDHCAPSIAPRAMRLGHTTTFNSGGCDILRPFFGVQLPSAFPLLRERVAGAPAHAG